jgi:hypothetical protein
MKGVKMTFDVGQIDAELIRRNKERIFALEREIAGREWHPEDPMRRELEAKLAKEQNALSDRLREIERQRSRYYGT